MVHLRVSCDRVCSVACAAATNNLIANDTMDLPCNEHPGAVPPAVLESAYSSLIAVDKFARSPAADTRTKEALVSNSRARYASRTFELPCGGVAMIPKMRALLIARSSSPLSSSAPHHSLIVLAVLAPLIRQHHRLVRTGSRTV